MSLRMKEEVAELFLGIFELLFELSELQELLLDLYDLCVLRSGRDV